MSTTNTHQVGFASFADGPAQIGGPQQQSTAVAAASGLMRRGGPHGLDEMDTRVGQRGGPGTPTRRRASAATTARVPVPYPADREKLCPVGLTGADRRCGRRILLAAGTWRDDVRGVVGVVSAAGAVRIGIRFGIGVGVGSLIRLGRQQLVEFVVVEPGRVERVAPTAMWQCKFGGRPQIVDVRVVAVVPGGVGGGGARHDDVGSHAVDTGRRADFGDPEQCRIGELDAGQDRLGVLDPIAKPLFGIRVTGPEGLRVGVELQSPAHDLGTLRRIPRRGNLDGETEAVE